MIEKDIYDKICDIFAQKIKTDKSKSVMHRKAECRKTKYHMTVFPPGIEEDRQSAYTFQCNDKAKMCTISGDAYILKEKSNKAVKELKSVSCDISNQREHVTANQVWFICAGKSYIDSLNIAKVLEKY